MLRMFWRLEVATALLDYDVLGLFNRLRTMHSYMKKDPQF